MLGFGCSVLLYLECAITMSEGSKNFLKDNEKIYVGSFADYAWIAIKLMYRLFHSIVSEFDFSVTMNRLLVSQIEYQPLKTNIATYPNLCPIELRSGTHV